MMFYTFALIATLFVVAQSGAKDSGSSTNSLDPSWLYWTTHGKNLNNDRYTPRAMIEHFTPREMPGSPVLTFDLSTPAWVFEAEGSVSATPAIMRDMIYFPDWAGYLWGVRTSDKAVIWKKNIAADYYDGSDPFLGLIPIISRTTPVPYKYKGQEYLIIGLQGRGADIMLVSATDGSLKAKLSLDTHFASIITQSGVVYDDHFYVGTSSMEELLAIDGNYPCCSFVGGFFKVSLPSLQTVGAPFRPIPEDISGWGKFSGVAIWGSSPAVDEKTKMVYIATGNNYQVPSDYSWCNINTPPQNVESVCNNVGSRKHNYFNSIIGLRTSDLSLVFGKRKSGYDAWSAACGLDRLNIPAGPNCPTSAGPDYDFGMAPTLGWINNRRVLFTGQKSGQVWCDDATTGVAIWSTQVSPGSEYGGISWGLAADEDTIYVSVSNRDNHPWTLTNGTVVMCGGWAALRQSDGQIKWTTANPACFDPSGPAESPNSNGRSSTAHGIGPPAVVGNTVLVGSGDAVFSPNYGTNQLFLNSGGGYAYALNKTDGSILSSYETGASIYGGFATNGACAYIGSGYRTIFNYSPGNKLFKWCTSLAVKH